MASCHETAPEVWCNGISQQVFFFPRGENGMRNVLRFGLASAALVISVVPAWSGVQPEGRELRVNLQLDSKQLNPVAAFAGNGSSAVVWENEGKGLRALFYGRDGNPSTGEVTLVA